MLDRRDFIVLGTSVGGAEAAAQAATSGMDVWLAIEQLLVGRECPDWVASRPTPWHASGGPGEAARVGQAAGKSEVERDWTMQASRVAEVSEH